LNNNFEKNFTYEVKFVAMEKEQWENGTCAVSVEGSWNIEMETLKVSEREIVCKINSTGVEIGIVMLDRVTGMPVIITAAN
jgi:hypothetical protein